jgi:hypothetical protein
MSVEAVQEGQRPSLAARLALNADGILEQIARDYGVSTLEVVRNLQQEHCTVADGKLFTDVMQDVTEWGDILFIVHTSDIVIECAGPLPLGTYGRGYYNVHGDSPIGGHIRADNCQAIAFVSRPFMGRPSRSIQFFNAAGEANVQDLRPPRRGTRAHSAVRSAPADASAAQLRFSIPFYFR